MPKANGDVTTLDLFDSSALSADERRKQKARDKARRYYANHRERILKTAQDRRTSDPEKHNGYARAWHQKNRDRVKAKANAKRAANPEAAREYERQWRELNGEKLRAQERERYAANRDKFLAKDREYRASRPGWSAKQALRWRGENPERYAVSVAKTRAKKRGTEFNLTNDWARARWTGRCELTGCEFVFSVGRPSPYSPSVDRIDATKGYTQDNCRFILWALNGFKGTGSDETMLTIARALVAKADATNNGE